VSVFQSEFPENFEERVPSVTPTNGKTTGYATTTTAPKAQKRFRSVSADTARAAKKGDTAKSRTGKSRQASVEFGKPPKHIWVKVYANPTYRQFNVPVFIDKDRDTVHYVAPEVYEGDELPERFKRACTLMDIYTAGLADGSFFLWTINVSGSKWRKAAVRAVQAALEGYVLVEAYKPRSTYTTFEALLDQAFDTTITSANDEVVNRYMSGGFWEETDEQGDE
jgi:hypothetical protein